MRDGLLIFSNQMFKFISLFLLSFVIVAFGQPSKAPLLCILAASVGYGLFWFTIDRVKKRLNKFSLAFLWYFLISAIQLSWMTAIEYQGIYILLVYALINVCVAAQFALLTLFVLRRDSRPVLHLAVCASGWALIEWSRMWVLCGFTWNPVGLALAFPSLPLQVASFAGIFGLSFWVVFTNGLFFHCFNKKQVWKRAVSAAVFPYLLGMLVIGYQYYIFRSTTPQKIRVAVVQTGLTPQEKNFLGNGASFIHPHVQWEKILTHLKDTGETQLDLIVLPEAAVPFHSDACIFKQSQIQKSFKNILNSDFEDNKTDADNLFWAQSLANHFKADVVLGLDRRFMNQEGIWENQNAAFFVKPDSKNPESYAKQILLPLAEYLPFSWLKPIVSKYGIQEFFSPGRECKIFSGKVPFATTICYEETFPTIVRKFRAKGAQLFINLTNDGWYPNSSLPIQHLHLGRLRAVENGVPVIRACNTGVSCIIDAAGGIQKIFSKNESDKGALIADLSLASYRTLYSTFGDGVLALIAFILLSFYLKKSKTGS